MNPTQRSRYDPQSTCYKLIVQPKHIFSWQDWKRTPWINNSVSCPNSWLLAGLRIGLCIGHSVWAKTYTEEWSGRSKCKACRTIYLVQMSQWVWKKNLTLLILNKQTSNSNFPYTVDTWRRSFPQQKNLTCYRSRVGLFCEQNGNIVSYVRYWWSTVQTNA